MKKILWITVFFATLATNALEQHECIDPNCTSCRAHATPVVEPVVPRMDEHKDDDQHEEHQFKTHVSEEADHDEHEGHDHAVEQTESDEHEGHDHVIEQAESDEHEEHDAEKQDRKEKNASLEIETATGGLVRRVVSFPAEIKINRDCAAAVSPKYAGTVRELHVEIGDTVKTGDVLATIESCETLANYSIIAPLTGTVVSRGKSVGELAGEEDVIFEVVDLSTVWVELYIFPQYRHAVRKGQAVRLIASDGHTAEVVIDYLSPLIDPETRTVKARCVLTGGENDFSPGAFVRAQITVESVLAAVRVEKGAVQLINGESIVFVQDEHGVEPRDVHTGISDGTFVEIKSGLKPGEKYVAHGAFDLKAELVTSGLDPHAGHGH